MQRREFITLLGGATATWPLAARAQQAMPVVGFLHRAFPGGFAPMVAGFRQGLSESSYDEGRNVTIEYRRAEGRMDRLPALAADLVNRQPNAIFANGPPAVRAVRAATATIPIVFSMGEDPVAEVLVASLSRPGGNITGHSWFANQVIAKRLGLLKEIVPKADVVALLVNPSNPNADPDVKEAQAAAATLGRQLHVLRVVSESDLEAAFTTIVERRIGALLVGVDGFFVERREQIAVLAARHTIAAIYDRREFAASGGLMSYGASQVDSWRHAGLYVGRILKGEKPGDLPVQQATKFEFVLNLKTAKALGLDIPPGVLAIADEVIE